MAAPITANTTMQIKRIQEKSGTDPGNCDKSFSCGEETGNGEDSYWF